MKHYKILKDALHGNTDRAICVRCGEHRRGPTRFTVWIPKSMIHYREAGQYVEIDVPRWLLDRHKLGQLDDIICE